MRFTRRSRWFLVILLIGGMLGCRGSATTGKADGPERDNADTSLEQYLVAVKQRGETPNYREAINLLSTHVKRQTEANPTLQSKLQLALEERTLLQERWKLSEGELAELEASSYTLLDASHLEFCYLMRDAARVLQQYTPGATRQELARWSFDWVTRQVRLQEEKRDPLPPEFVLRRGHGTALERALVFLALLQQHDIDGCLVGCRDDKNELFFWAAGALVEDKGRREMLLFDTRLGLPVPGPGGVATLAEVRKQPQLLPTLQSDGKPAYRATPEQAAKAEVYVAPPLSALSPRMRFLEGVLGGLDRVRLAYDPRQLLACFGPDPAGVWNAAAADAPVRLARGFLPPDEGGADKTGRATWFRRKAVPWLTIRQSFEFPNVDAEVQISRVVEALYKAYEARPREMLLRGKFDEATRRLVRIYDEYQRERESHRDLAQVRQMRLEWAQQVRKAYLDLANAKVAAQEAPPHAQIQARAEERNAQKLVEALLDDPYLVSVALGEDETGLMQKEVGEGQKKQKGPKRGLLTSIVMQSTMDTLGADAAYLQALVRQERAEPWQVRRERKPSGQAEAVRAWKNTQKGWDAYLGEYPFTPAEVSTRLTRIYQLNRRHELYLGTAMGMLEDLFEDLAKETQARLARARALEKAGQVEAAREALEKLPAELTAQEKVLESLEKGGFQTVRQLLNSQLVPLERQAEKVGASREASGFLNNLRNLSRDLAALENDAWRDNVRWLRAAALARLRQLPKR